MVDEHPTACVNLHPLEPRVLNAATHHHQQLPPRTERPAACAWALGTICCALLTTAHDLNCTCGSSFGRNGASWLAAASQLDTHAGDDLHSCFEYRFNDRAVIICEG
jgi:hypothetical protein